MIILSNLHTEQVGDWTRLVCNFTWDSNVPNPFTEKTIWFSVKNENADFFNTEVYDPFLLVPYYIAMGYGQDLKICGKVSKKLYYNMVNYIQRIFLDHSDALSPINLEVEGFGEVKQDGALVGAGFSCGVDSLSTVYDHFVKETVPGYKINVLFIFNCGGNGYFDSTDTCALFQTRYKRNKLASDELGLPLYQVESNLHAFTGVINIYKLTYLSNWSCVMSLQRKVQKYYVASSRSYEEVIAWHSIYHDKDIDDFCGMYLVPRIQTDDLELIYDGGQFKRTEKITNIADWNIARKHLNVCLTEKDTLGNCTLCEKCLRTCFTLDVIGKLNEFAGVFDLKIYEKVRFKNICSMLYRYKKNANAKDNIDLARANHVKLPPVWFAYIYMLPSILGAGLKKVLKHILGKEKAEQLKQRLRWNKSC